MYNNFSAHVDYWLDRDIGLRGRIGALGRRCGGDSGIGAWEMIRLIRSVYLATVYYGLEFVADYRPYIRRIQTHVNSTIQSLFRVPNKVATNTLLAETGIPLVHIQGRYIQRRCYARAITCRYNVDLPWFMEVRKTWADPDIQLSSLESERVLVSDTLIDIPPDKEEAIDVHEIVFGIAEDAKDAGVIYTDGSKNSNGAGAAWIESHHRVFSDPIGTTLPRDWSITQCELYAIWDALRSIDDGGRICLFTDAVSVLQMIRGMKPVGELAGLWHVLVPLLNRFDAVAFGLSPGHALIAGNEMADVAAKRASNGPSVNCRDICFGIRNHSVIGRKRVEEWKGWHADEGHRYYRRNLRPPRHMRGLTRLDAYVLLRLRVGVTKQRHNDCDDTDRFHLLHCAELEASQPDTTPIHDDQKIGEWMSWWRRHDSIGMGILLCARYIEDVRVVAGNPFSGQVYIRDAHGLRVADVLIDCRRCLRANCDGIACRRPVVRFPNRDDLVFLCGVQMRENRAICLLCLLPFGNIYEHLQHNGDHLVSWANEFWNNIADGWDDVEAGLANLLVIRHVTVGAGRCPRCGKGDFAQGGLGKHLRERSGDACFQTAWNEFVRWLEGGVYS